MIKRGLFIFIALSIVASGLNYIVYPLFSRVLPTSEYINITTSLSLFTQVSTFLSSILAVTIGLSKDSTKGEKDDRIELLQSFLFKLFGIVAVLFLIVSPLVMNQIHTSPLFALPICTMMLLSIPILIISGYLNGKNQIVKLGFVTLISASSQFIIGLAAASISHNGLLTMASMSIAQIIALLVIYRVFANDHLPSIKLSILTPITVKNKTTQQLLIFTALAAFAIMAISLIQIVDLFIIQDLKNVDIKFYTDLYVISRVVFFAGMIFVWPFLGEISLDHHHFNRKPFTKVIGSFFLISIGAIIILLLVGGKITELLFGLHYSSSQLYDIGILSITYKFLLLIITAIVLYFVVLQSYVAVGIALTTSGIVFIYSEFLNKQTPIVSVLVVLNIIALLSALISTVLLLRVPVKTRK